MLNQLVDKFPRVPMLNQMVLDKSPVLDRVFHALAHPARRSILRQLSRKEQNLTELAEPLEMSFPAASKHVRVLEQARLVRRRISGRTHVCRLEAAPLKEVAVWTEGYRRQWEATFKKLDAVLAEMQEAEAKDQARKEVNRGGRK
jgi:DNA-binding transcriptional ArsR family regulator